MAEGMIDCIEATSIPWCMVGLLTALPNTQLSRRLEKEGRMLHDVWRAEADQCTGGLNFVTLRPRREVLADYRAILERIYAPDAFFGRVRRVSQVLKRPGLAGPATSAPVRRPTSSLASRLASWQARLRPYKVLGRVVWRMTVRRPDLRNHFWRIFIECARHNPAALESVVTIMVVYLHLGDFAQSVIAELDRKIREEDAVSPSVPSDRLLEIA
jgi:hypothetical protein